MDVRTIPVQTGKAYEVHLGRGLLQQVGAEIRQLATVPGSTLHFDGGCLLVSDSNVGPLFAPQVRLSLEAAGFAVTYFETAAGESSKCLDVFGQLMRAMAQAHLTRNAVVVALGGGVVGDLAGFAAASYMRGCHLVQLPTSLLSMVDSSVGGKTGIDLPEGKNLVGAFYQPDLVLCDPDALEHLPQDFICDGMGEVIKYAMIGGAALLDRLLTVEPLQSAPQTWDAIIARCIEMKRDVVVADEQEAGLRKTLNYGHTVGHAIEKLSGYHISHGRAVAAGMAIICRASAQAAWCEPALPARLEAVLEHHQLPTTCPYAPDALYEALLADKKRSGAYLDLVIVPAAGRCEIRRTELEELRALLQKGSV